MPESPLSYVQRYVPSYTPIPMDAVSQMVGRVQQNADRDRQSMDTLAEMDQTLGAQVSGYERDLYNQQSTAVRERLAALAQNTDLGGVDGELRTLARDFRGFGTAATQMAAGDQAIRAAIDEVESPRRAQFLQAAMAGRQPMVRGEDGRWSQPHRSPYTFVDEGNLGEIAQKAISALHEEAQESGEQATSEGRIGSMLMEGVSPERALRAAVLALQTDPGAQGYIRNEAQLYRAQNPDATPEQVQQHIQGVLTAVAQESAQTYAWQKQTTQYSSDPLWASEQTDRRRAEDRSWRLEDAATKAAAEAGPMLTVQTGAIRLPGSGPAEATVQAYGEYLRTGEAGLATQLAALRETARQAGGGLEVSDEGIVTRNGRPVEDTQMGAEYRAARARLTQERRNMEQFLTPAFDAFKSSNASRFAGNGDWQNVFLNRDGIPTDRRAMELRAEIARRERDPAQHRVDTTRQSGSGNPLGIVVESDALKALRQRLAFSEANEREVRLAFQSTVAPRLQQIHAQRTRSYTGVAAADNNGTAAQTMNNFLNNNRASLQVYDTGDASALTQTEVNDLLSEDGAHLTFAAAFPNVEGQQMIQMVIKGKNNQVLGNGRPYYALSGTSPNIGTMVEAVVGQRPTDRLVYRMTGDMGTNMPGHEESHRYRAQDLQDLGLGDTNLEWIEPHRIGDSGSQYRLRIKERGVPARDVPGSFPSMEALVTGALAPLAGGSGAAGTSWGGARESRPPAGRSGGQVGPFRLQQGSASERGVVSSMVTLGQQYGLQPFQVAGILGNIAAESSFNLGAVNPGDQRAGAFRGGDRSSRGMAQWDPTRFANLQRFARNRNLSPTSAEAQAQFVFHEMQTTHPAAMRALLRSRNLEEATAAFAEHYERPAGSGTGNHRNISHWSRRYQAALGYLGE